MVIVQFEFPFEGPFGSELATAAKDLAASIAAEPGLLWKIWIESVERREAGGIYLFRDTDSAQAYIQKHVARLGQFGVTGPRVKMFEVNEPLTRATRGPLG
ncbi:MAG TPA: monooxygenase [Clostridia bacterium]|nr:monooxygenase [Clostridia bacterium]